MPSSSKEAPKAPQTGERPASFAVWQSFEADPMAEVFARDLRASLPEAANIEPRSVQMEAWLQTWSKTAPDERPLFAFVPSEWVHTLRRAGVLVPWPFTTESARVYRRDLRPSNVHRGRSYGVPVAARSWVLFASRDIFEELQQHPPTHWQDVARLSRWATVDRSKRGGFHPEFDRMHVHQYGLYIPCDPQTALVFLERSGVRLRDASTGELETSVADLERSFQLYTDARLSWGSHATWLDRAHLQIQAQELTSRRLALVLASTDLWASIESPKLRDRVWVHRWPLIEERRDTFVPLSGWSMVLTREGIDAQWLADLVGAMNASSQQRLRFEEHGVLPVSEHLYEEALRNPENPLHTFSGVLSHTVAMPSWGYAGEPLQSFASVLPGVCNGEVDLFKTAQNVVLEWGAVRP